MRTPSWLPLAALVLGLVAFAPGGAGAACSESKEFCPFHGAESGKSEGECPHMKMADAEHEGCCAAAEKPCCGAAAGKSCKDGDASDEKPAPVPDHPEA